MRIYLHELSEEPKQLHFTEKDAWVKEALLNTQEVPLLKTPSYLVAFEFRKSYEVVFMKGKMDVPIGLLCSRCANNFDYRLACGFQSLFTRKKSLGTTHANYGQPHPSEEKSSNENLEIEYIEKDYIELGDVLKEQVYLHLPFQPLCRKDCKGVCPVCGQDKNTQPCQCHRIKHSTLGNVLKNYKS